MEKLNLVYLSLGSNLGDRFSNLKEAIEGISEFGKIIATSKIYESQALGFESENNFLNLCLSIETYSNAIEFLMLTKKIEKALGRSKTGERSTTYSDRLIDIDIIFFNDEIINTEELIIPHPEFSSRKFVLQPLLDIVTNFKDPRTQETIANISLNCSDDSILVETNFCFDSKLTH